MSESTSLFPVSRERKEYNSIRLKYQRMAEESQRDFDNRYSSLFQDMDDIHNKAESVAMGYLGTAIDQAIKDLIKYGINEIDENEFYNAYIVDCGNNPWPEIFSKVHDKYMEIILDSEALDEYRTARRESRGRWIGGGFGVGGAIKGATGAAAANLAIGAVHGAFNLAAKGITAINNAFKKNELFNDPSTRDTLSIGIYYTVFSVHEALLEAANDKLPGTVTGYLKQVETDKAERVFGNITAGRIIGEDARKALLEILALDPYDESYYDHWLKEYGDADSKLEATARYFGLSNVSGSKEALICKKEKELDFSTPENCETSMVKLRKYGSSLGYLGIEEKCGEIKQLAQRLERERRTFNGKVYDSVEEMNVAKAQHEEIATRTANGKVYETIELAQQAQQKQQELDSRTVKGVVYDNVAKAETERNRRKVGFFLGIAIAIVPYIFAFGTLRKGYSWKARAISFTWMAITIAILNSGPK